MREANSKMEEHGGGRKWIEGRHDFYKVGTGTGDMHWRRVVGLQVNGEEGLTLTD